MFSIARDIVRDSIEFGRIYVPLQYLTAEEIHILSIERKPEKIPSQRIKQLSLKLIELNDEMLKEIESLEFLPKECRISTAAALQTCRIIGKTIKSRERLQFKTELSMLSKMKILFKILYIDSIKIH